MQAQNSTEVEESLMAALFYNHLCQTLMPRQKVQFPKATAVRERLSQLLSPRRNTYLNPKDTTITYISFDIVVNIINKLGIGALKVTEDMKNALRLIPVYPVNV